MYLFIAYTRLKRSVRLLSNETFKWNDSTGMHWLYRHILGSRQAGIFFCWKPIWQLNWSVATCEKVKVKVKALWVCSSSQEIQAACSDAGDRLSTPVTLCYWSSYPCTLHSDSLHACMLLLCKFTYLVCLRQCCDLETKGPRSWSWSRVITVKVSNLVSSFWGLCRNYNGWWMLDSDSGLHAVESGH